MLKKFGGIYLKTEYITNKLQFTLPNEVKKKEVFPREYFF